MTGFEPATLCSQSTCATKLRYIPFEITFYSITFIFSLCNPRLKNNLLTYSRQTTGNPIRRVYRIIFICYKEHKFYYKAALRLDVNAAYILLDVAKQVGITDGYADLLCKATLRLDVNSALAGFLLERQRKDYSGDRPDSRQLC